MDVHITACMCTVRKTRAHLGLCIDVGAAFDKRLRQCITALVRCMVEGGPVGRLKLRMRIRWLVP